MTAGLGHDGRAQGLYGRIVDCNRFDMGQFRPLVAFDAQGMALRVGAVHRAVAPRLESFRELFAADGDVLRLGRPGMPSAAVTAALDAAMRALYDRDRRGFGRWTGEPAPVLADWDGPVLFDVERAAHGLLGVKVRGVHVNGFTRGPDGAIRLWLARRSRDLAHHPGLLDQIAAGFLASGTAPRRAAEEEAAEEAGIDGALAGRLRQVSSISYCLQFDWNLVPGAVFIFDLELPPGFRPENRDGEVEGFELLTLPEVMERLQAPRIFKFDCALVALDFLARHGALEGHPDYLRIIQGLHVRGPWDGPLQGGQS
ncbi:DUF4743 domain-containing protein [Marinibaculum pumilum]|uniref:DUF4743 domain-containing protein n=1 Tax=Marinibaculum pumilum TaxID=1766165 RepID=A0ABV7KX77_9PROT